MRPMKPLVTIPSVPLLLLLALAAAPAAAAPKQAPLRRPAPAEAIKLPMLVRMGDLLLASGQVRRAISFYDRFRFNFDAEPLFWRRFAALYEQAGDLERALACLEHVSRLEINVLDDALKEAELLWRLQRPGRRPRPACWISKPLGRGRRHPLLAAPVRSGLGRGARAAAPSRACRCCGAASARRRWPGTCATCWPSRANTSGGPAPPSRRSSSAPTPACC